MSDASKHRKTLFKNESGLTLVADVAGDFGARPLFFLHGGGQTRQSWKTALDAVARIGFCAYALDARGHGESDRAPDGNYTLNAMVSDLLSVIGQVGGGLPVLIGASMGGLVALQLVASAKQPVARGLVLVDVASRTNPEGTQRVQSFMRGNPNGFASLDEAADAVAGFNKLRRRPSSHAGLARNLRKVGDRYFWHYDPRFLDSWNGSMIGLRSGGLDASAARLTLPTLLVHAAASDVITDEEARHFLTVVQHAEYIKVNNAGHMVVGDRNDAFNKAIVDFITAHFLAAPK